MKIWNFSAILEFFKVFELLNFLKILYFLKTLNFFQVHLKTKNRETKNFEAVEQMLKGGILKLKSARDKCPKEEKMRHPLAFHAEGKKFREVLWSAVVVMFPGSSEMGLDLVKLIT